MESGNSDLHSDVKSIKNIVGNDPHGMLPLLPPPLVLSSPAYPTEGIWQGVISVVFGEGRTMRCGQFPFSVFLYSFNVENLNSCFKH